MSNNEINVAKALKEKSPRIYQFTPSILLKKLTELVHEEEINEILQKLNSSRFKIIICLKNNHLN